MDAYRQHELPETVKRYKQYTDAFQEWLVKTAVQRGVESAAQIAEQAKTKKKGKKSYKMSTEQQQILVDGIAGSKEPLSDTSGLRDLKDAIRSRKEVTQYHKHSSTWDSGHAFFNLVLESAHSKLTTFIGLIPVMLKSQDLEDEASTFAVYRFQQEVDSDDEDDVERTRSRQTYGLERNQKNKPLPSKVKEKGHTLSEKDAEVRRDFLVLCFLYELNRIREIVREVWMEYRQDVATAVTAALVTDLAQSYIQQNVAALVEDLASYDDSVPQLSLSAIVRQLFTKLSGRDRTPNVVTQSSGLSDTALRHLLCIKALDHFTAYAKPKPSKNGAAREAPDPQLPFLPFLRHFDAIRRKRVTLPIWDKFTESMIKQTGAPDMYLPFGFQIVLDVNETMGGEYRKINRDVIQQGFDIARLIRTHIDYEDRMWETGTKPDYMSASSMKFSNVYLSTLDSILNWIQEVLKTKKDEQQGTPSTYMATDAFVAMHPTIGGLSTWNFNRTYNGFSISKVSWFITAICHLYNAAMQIGGLDVVWPDLDHIIDMHDPDRIFVGGYPTDPKDFLERFYLSICVSSRSFAKDYRSNGSTYPLVPPELRKKRGLMVHFPLENTIAKYYGPDRNNDRWLKRHAVFNHLHGVMDELPQEFIDEHIEIETDELTALRENFESIVTKLMPAKSNNRRKKRTRVHPPDVTGMDNTYPALLRTMNISLQSNELHSGFDYLAFYRRAHALVIKIRKEVLLDEASQLARRGDIRKGDNPSNVSLLVDLFTALKIKPKDKKIESTGDEVSTDVVPLEQLKRIARIMKDVITEEGSEELDRAQMRKDRDWDGLKAAYAADDAKADGQIPESHDAPHPPAEPEEDGIPTEGVDLEVQEIKDPSNNVEQPPPDHWPADQDQDGCEAKATVTPAEPMKAASDATDQDTKVSEESTIGDPSVSDNRLSCDHCTAGDTDPEVHSTGDTLKLDTKLLDEDTNREFSGVPVEITSSKDMPQQAYVADEADTELHGPGRESFRENASECLLTSKFTEDAATQDAGLIEQTVTEIISDLARSLGEHILDMIFDMEKASHLNPTPLEPTATEAIDIGDGEHQIHEQSIQDSATIEELLSPKKAKHNGKPKGVFHRLVYSRNALLKRLVTIKRTSAAPRLTFARRRKGYLRRSIIVTRKHTVSLRCYAACSLARALLGRQSKLQCRLLEATKAILAQKSSTLLDLQAAWHMASATTPEKIDVEDVVWTDDDANIVAAGGIVSADVSAIGK